MCCYIRPRGSHWSTIMCCYIRPRGSIETRKHRGISSAYMFNCPRAVSLACLEWMWKPLPSDRWLGVGGLMVFYKVFAIYNRLAGHSNSGMSICYKIISPWYSSEFVRKQWLLFECVRAHKKKLRTVKFIAWGKFPGHPRGHHVTLWWWRFWNNLNSDFRVCYLPHISGVLVALDKKQLSLRNWVFNFWLCQHNRILENWLCRHKWILKFRLRQHNWHSGQLLALRPSAVKWCVMIPFSSHSYWSWSSGLGRAKTPEHFLRGQLLMWLCGEIWKDRYQMVSAPQLWKHFFLWIGFWLSHHQFLQGVRFFGISNPAMLRIEQNLPARSRKRGEAPIPRVGKWLPGFGIEQAPSREGVSALDHQATPAAWKQFLFV